jgi:hypothetical protein
MASASPPKASFYMVSEADFRPLRAGDSVSFGLGGGGAQPNPDAFGIAAPLHVPDGSTITNVRVYYRASSAPPVTLSAELRQHSILGNYGAWGINQFSTVISPDVQFIDVPPSPFLGTAPNVDNSSLDYTLVVSVASGQQWGSTLFLICAVITYNPPG